MAAEKKKALVIFPGRGSYNANELGYLHSHHGANNDWLHMVDKVRSDAGQPPITQMDKAEKFTPSTHLTGDNASLLIYACAMADFMAINRDKYDVVAVTGNSMGWYLALAGSGILSMENGAKLVNNMGNIMHEHGVGGQIIYPISGDDWHIDKEKYALVHHLLTEAKGVDGIRVELSINLGGMAVFAADDAGLRWLMEKLPKSGNFPLKLAQHAAFHSPILDHILPLARAANPAGHIDRGQIPAIDGDGCIWSPHAFEQGDIFDYTLGRQINRTYDYSKAVSVAVREFAPDQIILTGPGNALGAVTAQSLIQMGAYGLKNRDDFMERQAADPIILSMGLAEQRQYIL
ncbi:hypothetical protein LPB140_05500 [Sphingorhabdus lutea]|uniref:[acyl-carrier-protein] S-malonyltransferase n=1 Tax=Sphingorhabdus lutea TaxID=1913578 RepID=A0A1L3JB40_9SPHN|nr:hypothetical protein [Sphingorhabdus lutea]APG62342.1 hypothetical protein LPB140_05500 [Sphingorhabdus lutea]